MIRSQTLRQIASIFMIALLCAFSASGQEIMPGPDEAKPEKEAAPVPGAKKSGRPVGDPYTLPVCAVTGEKLDDKRVVINHKGREIRVASEEAARTFNADLEKYIKQIDVQMIEAQLPFYPLEHCVVNEDHKLGGHDMKPADLIYNNRLIRLCCPDCSTEIAADPAKYLKKLDAAVIKAQTADYPFAYCLLMPEEKLGPGGERPRSVVIANQLVHVCCSKCQLRLLKDPAKYLAELDGARPKKQSSAPAAPQNP